MESPNLLPSVQCNTDCEFEAFESVLSLEELLSMQRRLSEDKMPSLSQALGGMESERRAGLSENIHIVTSVRGLVPQVSVITSSNTRKQGHSPSFEGWGSGPSRKAHPTIGASSNTHLPTIPTPYHIDLFSGIALHCTDFTANYSNNLKDRDNENNMQSVKNRLVLDYIDNIECKGIVNDILISDISLILCVPNIQCQNHTTSCNLSELMQQNIDNKNLTAIRADTNVLGAFPQTLENISQKTVDNFCDPIIFLKRILKNQIIGMVPYNSIPVFKNAITVQGMVYGHPHSNSFNSNLIFNGAVPDREPLNKSDYAFYDAIRIISNHSVFKESEILSTKLDEYRDKDEEQFNYEKEEVNFEKQSDQTSNNNQNNRDDEQYETFANGEYTFSALLKMVSKTSSNIVKLVQESNQKVCLDTWGLPNIFRLMGGGESSLNAASGWGSPPNSSNNNGNATGNWGSAGTNNQTAATNATQAQWGSAAQRPPATQPDGNSNKVGNNTNNSNGAVGTSSGSGSGWASTGPASAMPPTSQPNNTQPNAPPSQNGGNNSPGGNSNSGGPPILPSSSGSGTSSTTPAPSTAKAQIEQLNTMRESLFSLDGWGGQHVNQDTNWDVPNSPEPGVKLEPGSATTSAGGPPVWKPNANNGTDLWEANLRNGGQPPAQPVAKAPWGHTPTTNIGGTWGEDDDTPESSNVWTGPPPPQQWGGPPQQPPHWNAAGKKDDWGGWGEQHRPDMHRPDMHNRDLRAPAPDPREMRALMAMEGRGDMRGDPRGISGRLNGSSDMWGQHHMPHTMQPQNKMMPTNVGNGVNQWGAQGPKDISMVKSGIGWDEASPPTARRNVTSFDDGTSLWGQQRGGGGGGGGGGVALGPWKDMSGGMGRGTMQCPPGMPPGNRMPSVAPNQMKPEGMWGGHPHRNGAWDENSSHSSNWEKDGMAWNEGPMNQSGWTGPKKPMGGPAGSWDSDMGDWCGPKPPGGGPPGKIIPKDVIWNSKQFRLLVDMGYKKDDVELALRSCEMNVEEAMDLLGQMRGRTGIESWRRHEEHQGPPFDHQQQYPAPPRPHHAGFPQQQPSAVPFAQPGQGINSINNISPALVQKILNQPSSQPPPPFNQQNNQGGGDQPRTQQLRMLVQQIQMAVSAGYLNNQILNQPLAPQTLVLLNQLLQQIKILQQLATQHSAVSKSMANSNSSQAAYHQAGISVDITKTKQQITNLQNQIAAQQGIYVKQQARNAGGSGGSSTTGDFFNKGHDPINQMQNTFAELGINKEQSAVCDTYNSGGQQSRLNQWKLPSLDKEPEGSEFSRAPGTTSKAITSPQLNPLGLQGDNTWSSGRSVNDGWPSSDAADLPDGKESWSSPQQPQGNSTYTDLVPEFEPGKPWKGNQMKSIEDDPAITPGSVARSPLSLAAIKDTDIFGSSNQGKSSPTTPSERSLSSSTWSYPPPPVSTPSSFNIPKTAAAKTSWGDTPTTTGSSALWGSNSNKPRGPPPGLVTSKSGSSWTSSGGSSTQSSQRPFAQQQNWQSTWLLLKNLTAQIDGSTLKTLCMQHGPLQNFHLYLNQGIALAKYSTREEANKAQTALNNCVLGNTTIFAESPGDSDVDMILQHLSQGGGSGQWRGTGNGSNKANPTGTGGSTGTESWPFPSTMWGENLSEQRATPSNLSSYLPNDLLSSESM